MSATLEGQPSPAQLWRTAAAMRARDLPLTQARAEALQSDLGSGADPKTIPSITEAAVSTAGAPLPAQGDAATVRGTRPGGSRTPAHCIDLREPGVSLRVGLGAGALSRPGRVRFLLLQNPCAGTASAGLRPPRSPSAAFPSWRRQGSGVGCVATALPPQGRPAGTRPWHLRSRGTKLTASPDSRASPCPCALGVVCAALVTG